LYGANVKGGPPLAPSVAAPGSGGNEKEGNAGIAGDAAGGFAAPLLLPPNKKSSPALAGAGAGAAEAAPNVNRGAAVGTAAVVSGTEGAGAPKANKLLALPMPAPPAPELSVLSAGLGLAAGAPPKTGASQLPAPAPQLLSVTLPLPPPLLTLPTTGLAAGASSDCRFCTGCSTPLLPPAPPRTRFDAFEERCPPAVSESSSPDTARATGTKAASLPLPLLLLGGCNSGWLCSGGRPATVLLLLLALTEEEEEPSEEVTSLNEEVKAARWST
jgi:hypothetical protein